jgi:hypothetical protein
MSEGTVARPPVLLELEKSHQAHNGLGKTVCVILGVIIISDAGVST